VRDGKAFYRRDAEGANRPKNGREPGAPGSFSISTPEIVVECTGISVVKLHMCNDRGVMRPYRSAYFEYLEGKI
jgi:hypothetical protein